MESKPTRSRAVVAWILVAWAFRLALAEVETVKLVATDSEDGDAFGWAVATSGDAILVGAPDHDDPAGSGAAYVFRRVAGAWSEEAVLKASDAGLLDGLGVAVALDGDVALLGAPDEDSGGSSAGATYVFRFDGVGWVEEQKLVASDAAAGDDFGRAVSIRGPLAVVGAPGHADGAGAVYAFFHDGSRWEQVDKLVAADPAAGDQFGISVSAGRGVIAVGADLDDEGGSVAGAGYVFRFDGVGWSQEQKLLSADIAPNDRFGQSIAIDGDVVLVGAFGDDQRGDTSGSAYRFGFDGVGWVEEQKLTASDGAPVDLYGWSVALSGCVAVVGARLEDASGADSGSAYLLRDDGPLWIEPSKLIASDGDPGDELGSAVAVSPSVAVVGSWRHDTAGRDSGAVYVYSDVAVDCCRVGGVGAAAGDPVDVLTVNGSDGGAARSVTVAADSELTIALTPAPSPAVDSRYYVGVWVGAPTAETVASLAGGLGLGCYQPQTDGPGHVQPQHVANTLLVGDPRLDPPTPSATGVPGTELPADVIVIPADSFAPGTVLTVQGMLGDAQSTASIPGSLTNAIVVTLD